MQVSVSTTGSLGRRLEVAVPATEIAQEVEQRLKSMSRTARLKGFRPGKVPFAVIRQQFGDAVHAEVVNDVMRSSLGQALDQQKLRPAAGPRIEAVTMEPGADLKYAAVFEVMPEVRLKPVSEMTLERPVAEVKDSDIDTMITSMRRQRMEWKEFEGAARDGDRVLIDFDGKIDGEAFEGGAGQDVEVVLGQGQAAKELDEGLKGTLAGEQRTIELTFPQEHRVQAIAGRTAQLEVHIKRVDEPILPEVDEEFCRAYGVEEGGIDALRAEVRKSMEQELASLVRARLRAQVIDKLHEQNTVEVPRTMVEVEMQRLQVDAGRRMGIQDASKLPPAEQFRDTAQRRTALSLIMGQIVQNESLRPDAAKVQERVNEIAASYPDPDRTRQQIIASQQLMEQVSSAVLEDQVVDWVLGQAQITDKPLTFAEVTGFGREERSAENSENPS